MGCGAVKAPRDTPIVNALDAHGNGPSSSIQGSNNYVSSTEQKYAGWSRGDDDETHQFEPIRNRKQRLRRSKSSRKARPRASSKSKFRQSVNKQKKNIRRNRTSMISPVSVSKSTSTSRSISTTNARPPPLPGQHVSPSNKRSPSSRLRRSQSVPIISPKSGSRGGSDWLSKVYGVPGELTPPTNRSNTNQGRSS